MSDSILKVDTYTKVTNLQQVCSSCYLNDSPSAADNRSPEE